MKYVSKIITLLVFTFAAHGAQAQLYGDLSYTALTFKDTGGGNTVEASPNVMGVTIGYDLHKNLAAEGQYIVGLNDDAVRFNGAATVVRLKLENSYGVFLKPKAALGENLEVFGRLGYVKSRFTDSVNGALTYDGLAYGLGANCFLSKTLYLTAQYLSLYDNASTKVNGFALGLGVKF